MMYLSGKSEVLMWALIAFIYSVAMQLSGLLLPNSVQLSSVPVTDKQP